MSFTINTFKKIRKNKNEKETGFGNDYDNNCLVIFRPTVSRKAISECVQMWIITMKVLLTLKSRDIPYLERHMRVSLP